jgi:hypothetical protein
MNCPKCNAFIATEDIYTQSDIAKCQACNNVFKISDAVAIQKKFDPNLPPEGAWYFNDFETTIVGATTRTKGALFLIPFMLVWSGFSLGGIYGTQIINGQFNPFLSLFGIPFIIGTVVFSGVILMSIAGKVVVTYNNNEGKIFTGVGKLGLTQAFLWKDINAVEESISSLKKSSGNSYKISLSGPRNISFGRGLSDERRYYIISVLQNYLKNRR